MRCAGGCNPRRPLRLSSQPCRARRRWRTARACRHFLHRSRWSRERCRCNSAGRWPCTSSRARRRSASRSSARCSRSAILALAARSLAANARDLPRGASVRLVMAAMNACFYEGIARVPLGAAVTIEFWARSRSPSSPRTAASTSSGSRSPWPAWRSSARASPPRSRRVSRSSSRRGGLGRSTSCSGAASPTRRSARRASPRPAPSRQRRSPRPGLAERRAAGFFDGRSDRALRACSDCSARRFPYAIEMYALRRVPAPRLQRPALPAPGRRGARRRCGADQGSPLRTCSRSPRRRREPGALASAAVDSRGTMTSCAAASPSPDPPVLAERFEVELPEDWAPSYNVAPTQEVLGIGARSAARERSCASCGAHPALGEGHEGRRSR